MKVPITKPFFGPEEKEAVVAALDSGWIVQGPRVTEFEKRFTEFTHSQHAAAASSCTTALHMAVAALDLKPGQEVIVPAFTWVATANVVEYMGATPVFCDIDLGTFNIDVHALESLITRKTVGIIPVHLFGLCADLEPILTLAKKHKLWVVEDAACAFGATYHGKHAGLFGEFGCFSFHPRKSLTTGEGGMVTTQDEGRDEIIRSLRDHGASKSDMARHQSKGAFLLAEYNRLGFNFRMTDLQAAVGCVQMQRAPQLIQRRRAVASRYDQRLKDLEWIKLPATPAGYQHGYQAYVTLFAPETPALKNVERLHDRRNRIMTSLEEQGISTRQGTHSPILQGYYRKKYGLRPEQFPNSVLADRLTLTLPLYPQMTEEEQDYVCQGLEQVFTRIA